MSAINTLAGGYYQLNNLGTGLANTQASSTPTDALLQAMSSLDNSNNASSQSSDAFLLDLSPQAQSLLNGAGGTRATSLGNVLGTGSNFILSAQQQQKVSDILAKYKDAPYTQDTFNQIQNDLRAAGLAPDTLSLKDQTQSFDPSMVLIDALNGTSDSSNLLGTDASNAGEQTKSSNYMANILKQWQNVSTTYQASTAASGTASA